MNIKQLDFVGYLTEILGDQPAIERIDPEEIRNVALHLKHAFSYYRSKIAEREVVFAMPITDHDLNSARTSLNIGVLSRSLGVPVILVLDELNANQRRTYINRRVPFILPGKQLFIPQLLIDLKPTQPSARRGLKYFSPATQSVLIHHLHLHELDGMDQRSIAGVVRYSEMTISRAISQLKSAKAITVTRYGVRFLEDRQQLWTTCLPYLRSPVVETVYASVVKEAPVFLFAGFSALSHYTEIANPRHHTYAIPSETFKHLRDKHFHHIDHIEGEVEVQLWRYCPGFLSESKFVDPFSLYLSLYKEENDERTSAALEALIGNIL